MPSTTPIYGLRYPNNNELQGDAGLKNLAEDTENIGLPLVGVIASRPAASAVKGGLSYYATDTGELYITDHVRWYKVEKTIPLFLDKWRYTSEHAQGVIPAGNGPGTRVMEIGFNSGNTSGIGQIGIQGPAGLHPAVFRWSGTNRAIAGKTLKVRIVGYLLLNEVAGYPTNWRIAIQPYNSHVFGGGGSGNILVKFGDATGLPTDPVFVDLTSPTNPGIRYFEGSEVTTPADGIYCFTMNFTAGTIPASGIPDFRAWLQTRYI